MRGLKGRWEGGGCVAVGGEERESEVFTRADQEPNVFLEDACGGTRVTFRHAVLAVLYQLLAAHDL